jgi:hypothetical protein
MKAARKEVRDAKSVMVAFCEIDMPKATNVTAVAA